jgi:hypothetical protein
MKHPHAWNWDRKGGSLEYQTMEKFQKPSNSVCYTPPSEPFRTKLNDIRVEILYDFECHVYFLFPDDHDGFSFPPSTVSSRLSSSWDVVQANSDHCFVCNSILKMKLMRIWFLRTFWHLSESYTRIVLQFLCPLSFPASQGGLYSVEAHGRKLH